MIGWALGKFAPNLANLVRKLWSTRMVTVPKSYAYRNVPINKWPKDISKVKMNIPVGFTTKKVPFEQGYAWNRPMGGIAYEAPTLKKTGATFLPKGTNVGGRVVVAKAKEPAKIGFAGVTGTALGYASTQKRSTAGISTPRVQRKDVFPVGKFGKTEKRVSVSTGPATSGFRQTAAVPKMSSVKTNFGKTVAPRSVNVTVPKAKVPVAKVAKTPKVSRTTTAKPGGAKWTSPSGKKFNYSDQLKLRGMGIAHSQGKIGGKTTKTVSAPKTTAASRKATAAGILTAKIIRKFGIKPEQVRASDISERKRLEKERGGSIAGPKKATGFKSPFEGDIVKRAASGYHIFKKGSKGALSFQAAYKAAKGKKFKWKGTGKWYK